MIALARADDPVNSCGWTASTRSAGSGSTPTDRRKAMFHYDIDVSKLDSDGFVQVTSTGSVGTTTRTLQVGVGEATRPSSCTTPTTRTPTRTTSRLPEQMDSRCADVWWNGRAKHLQLGGLHGDHLHRR